MQTTDTDIITTLATVAKGTWQIEIAAALLDGQTVGPFGGRPKDGERWRLVGNAAQYGQHYRRSLTALIDAFEEHGYRVIHTPGPRGGTSWESGTYHLETTS
jgi:hypothetical protein